MKNDFIDGGIITFQKLVAVHFYFQQKALLHHGFAVVDQIHLLNDFVGVNIGKKAQIPAVDADHMNIKPGKHAGCAKHIAVATYNDCQVGLFTNGD